MPVPPHSSRHRRAGLSAAGRLQGPPSCEVPKQPCERATQVAARLLGVTRRKADSELATERQADGRRQAPPSCNAPTPALARATQVVATLLDVARRRMRRLQLTRLPASCGLLTLCHRLPGPPRHRPPRSGQCVLAGLLLPLLLLLLLLQGLAALFAAPHKAAEYRLLRATRRVSCVCRTAEQD